MSDDGWQVEHRGPGELDTSVCPVERCRNTDDLWFMECARGYTWTFVNGCGHWGFIYRKTDVDVPRETSELGLIDRNDPVAEANEGERHR